MIGMPDLHADLDRRAGYHPPRTDAVIHSHERAREIVRAAGHELVDLLEPVQTAPEVVKMLDALDLALMHANAAIARHHPDNA